MIRAAISILACWMGCLAPLPAGAGERAGGRAVASARLPVVEGSAGYAGFLDESLVDHGVIGGAARWYVTDRVSVGPELVYMVGPGRDRDLIATANLQLDLVRAGGGAVQPYALVGAGFFRHTDGFGQVTFSSVEGAVTGGGGVRLAITPRLTIAPELRLGWEPHLRVGVTVGYRPGR